MKKYVPIVILFLALNCRSSQIKDQKVIDNNNQLIEEVKDTNSTVDNLNISDNEKSKIKSTLSKCSEYSEDSNNAITKCHYRENDLKEKVSELKSKIGVYFKIMIGEGIFILFTLVYLRYFKR